MGRSQSDDLRQYVNRDQPGQELAVILNTADDEGGFDGSSVEGGKYVLPGIVQVLSDTRMRLSQLELPALDLSDVDPGDPHARFLPQIVEHSSKSSDAVHEAFIKGEKVLSLGGNHVRALDVIGALRACHEQKIKMGMVWVDAHPDLNTHESTVSGHIHGMPSAVLQGRGPKELLDLLKGAPFIDPHDFIYIGINAIDDPKHDDGSEKSQTELKYLQELIAMGVQCFPMETLKIAGEKKVVPDAVKNAVSALSDRLKAQNGKLWVEWDVDSVDVTDMPAAVMDNRDGMSGKQIEDLFRHIGTNCDVSGVGVSELVPQKDQDGKAAKLVAESVGFLFGVNNPNYSFHMDRARKEMEDAQNAVPLKLLTSSSKRGENRFIKYIAATLAGVGGVLANANLIHESPIPLQPTVDTSRLNAHTLDQFSRSDFLSAAARLRLMVETHNQKGIEDAWNEMSAIYRKAKEGAPDAETKSDLGQVAHNLFERGFSGGTHLASAESHKYYEEFARKILWEGSKT